MNDPVVHDQHLNEAFRQDQPKKPEPVSEDIKISWVEVVPKFSHLRGVQITKKNMDDIALLHGFLRRPAYRGLRASIYVPTPVGDVAAYEDDWLMVADDNWDVVTVCSAEAFTRNYEVLTHE